MCVCEMKKKWNFNQDHTQEEEEQDDALKVCNCRVWENKKQKHLALLTAPTKTIRSWSNFQLTETVHVCVQFLTHDSHLSFKQYFPRISEMST